MISQRITPQVRVYPGQNLASKAFTVATGEMKDLVLFDGPDALGGIALYLAGFSLRTGDEANPTVNWALHPGNGNIIDDDPICTGSTFLIAGKLSRQGLLFDVRGRDATTWLLRGYCTLKTNPYSVLASITLSPLSAGTSPQTITAGPVIG